MTVEKAIELMENEKACIIKADTCDKNCAKCELLGDTKDLLSAHDMAIQTLKQTKWIPCSERIPEEHEWIGTKKFGTTISDEVYVTFENPEGKRFVKHIRFENGKLSSFDQSKIDVFCNGSVPIAWMPLPKPYEGEMEVKE